MDSRELIKTKLIEYKIAKYTKSKYCKLLSSGTLALELCIDYLNFSSTDNIIAPSWGYPCVENILRTKRVTIKYADVKLDTLCLDPDLVEHLIDDNTKAIYFMCHQGYVGEDVIRIKNIADKYNLIFFEDSAQGLGQFYKGQHCGTFGEFGVISFSWPKFFEIGTVGGCVITNNIMLYRHLCKLCDSNYSFMLDKHNLDLLDKNIDRINQLLVNRRLVFKEYKRYIDILETYTPDGDFATPNLMYISSNSDSIINDIVLMFDDNIHKSMNKLHRYNRKHFYNDKYMNQNAQFLYKNYIELPVLMQDLVSFDNIEKICEIIKKYDTQK